jgi:hypothetical protein
VELFLSARILMQQLYKMRGEVSDGTRMCILQDEPNVRCALSQTPQLEGRRF